MSLAFAYRKATQALNFFARKNQGKIDKLKALKLVFFADRYHIRKYGRTITNDRYYAMNYGPVPSGTKDLAEQSEFLSALEKEYSQQFLRPSSTDKHALESLAEVENTVFSESDLEALEYAWELFGQRDAFELADLTHQYPEWKRHEAAITSGESTRMPMVYDDFLEDPQDSIEPCYTLTDAERELRRDLLTEVRNFEAKWG